MDRWVGDVFGSQCCTYIPSTDPNLTSIIHRMREGGWDPFSLISNVLGVWNPFMLIPVIIALACFVVLLSFSVACLEFPLGK